MMELYSSVCRYMAELFANPYLLITQIVGFCASILTISSFQFKTQKGIMMVQSISTLIWTIHFFMLGAYSGALFNFMCWIRSMIYANRSKHAWARSISWVYIFSVLSVAICVMQFTAFGKSLTVGNIIIESVAAIGVISTNIGYRLDAGFKVRCSQFVSSPCWFTYNLFNGSVGGMITEVISFCSAAIGILRHDIKRNSRTAQ